MEGGRTLEALVAVVLLSMVITTIITGINPHGKVKTIAMTALACEIIIFIMILIHNL
jgi:hypothetical protein